MMCCAPFSRSVGSSLQTEQATTRWEPCKGGIPGTHPVIWQQKWCKSLTTNNALWGNSNNKNNEQQRGSDLGWTSEIATIPWSQLLTIVYSCWQSCWIIGRQTWGDRVAGSCSRDKYYHRVSAQFSYLNSNQFKFRGEVAMTTEQNTGWQPRVNCPRYIIEINQSGNVILVTKSMFLHHGSLCEWCMKFVPIHDPSYVLYWPCG